MTCIDLTPYYFVSAGVDGSVRVWSDTNSHQLVGNFDEHKKKVTARYEQEQAEASERSGELQSLLREIAAHKAELLQQVYLQCIAP